MRRSMLEGLFQSLAKSLRLQGLNPSEQSDIRKVFHAGVRAGTRHRVGMQLFRDVGFDRIKPQDGRRNASEVEYISRSDNVGLSKDRISKGDIDAEALSVELPGESTLGTKPQTFVPHSVVLDGRVLGIGIHFEGHEVTEILSARLLEIGK